MGDGLAREFVRRTREHLAARSKRPAFDYDLGQSFQNLGRLIPPALADEVEPIGQADTGRFDPPIHQFDQFVETLRFRREMHQEFAR
jgi:hypothetical protein